MKKFLATLTLAAFTLTISPIFAEDPPKDAPKTEHKKKKGGKKKAEEKKDEKKG